MKPKMVKNKRTEILNRWFPGKFWCRYPVVRVRGGCPLNLRDRLMWGYLAGLSRKGWGASLGEVARVTGLSRTRAVIESRDRLLRLDVVGQDSGSLHALSPWTSPVAPHFVQVDKEVDHWSLGY